MEVLLIIIVALVIFLLVDIFCSKPKRFTGEIIDKQYKAESASTNTGVVTNSNGNTTVITTTEFNPEKWILIVKKQDGEIITVKSSSEIYYSKSIGESVDFDTYFGLFTKYNYGSTAV